MAERLSGLSGIAAIELNISCPNVSGGVDYGTDAESCGRLVAGVREHCSLPVLAKLTPNVTSVVEIAQAASEAGADALSLITTVLGLCVAIPVLLLHNIVQSRARVLTDILQHEAVAVVANQAEQAAQS